MVDKIWLASYPPGVPASIDADRYPALPALLANAFSRFAERPALASFGARVDYQALDELSLAFAAYLQTTCGIERGDRIALMMPNMLAYPVALCGVLRAGGVVVNVNPLYTPRELEQLLEDSEARAVVVFENVLPTLEHVLDASTIEQVVVARIGDFMPWLRRRAIDFISRRRMTDTPHWPKDAIALRDAVSGADAGRFTAPPIDPEDLAFLQYTGGTTGRSKGAMLSHRNILANLEQVTAWFDPHVVPGEEIIITALPLYHIYALTGNCFATISRGGLNTLITDPRDLGGFVRQLRRTPFTSITGVNTLFQALLEHPDFKQVDFSHLKLTNAGGMAVQRAVAERWHATTGCIISEGYGLTEASPVVTANRPDVETFSGSIGLPMPSTEIRIVSESGEELGVEEPGELCVRGPQVMQGYWRDTEASAAVLDDEGWLHTGDIARIDDQGYLYLVDRKKDLIVVSGFNVYPNEIEDVVAHHPGVREVAVIGVADAHSGEAVRLVVVPDDEPPDEAALIEWCRERLTAYKIPRSVVFTDALPKSPIGKILKREVREAHGEPNA